MRIYIKSVVFFVLLCAFLAVCSCSYEESSHEGEEFSSAEVKDSSEQEAETDFYSAWSGGEITREAAAANGCVFYNDGQIDGISQWNDFETAVKLRNSAKVSVCTSGSVMLISCVEDKKREGMLFTVSHKFIDDEKSLHEESTKISCKGITSVLSDKGTEYYIGDRFVLSVSSQNTEARFVPFEYEIYSADSGANVSFPFYKVFASYEDFKKYYDAYHEELNLSELNKSMSEYDSQGGLNTHVVFLCGDIEGSDSVEYSVSTVVKGNGGLDIYLKKYVPAEKSNQVAKRQTVVKIPSEYLDDVNPERIHWIAYSEFE